MKITKSEIFYLLFLMAVSCLLFIVIYPKYGKIGTDTALYAIVGKNFISGEGFTLYGQPHTIFSPLLPITMGVFYFLIRNLDLAAHLATLFFAVLAMPLFYFLVKEAYSKKTAYIALLFFVFFGQAVWQYSVAPSAQIVAGFFAVLLFYSLFKIIILTLPLGRGGLFWPAAAGGSVGLAYLARPEYFFLIFIVLIFLYLWFRGKINRRQILMIVGTVAVAFSVFFLPYAVFLKQSLGYWTISGRGAEALMHMSGAEYEKVDLSSAQAGDINTAIISPPKLADGAFFKFFTNLPGFLKRYGDNLINFEKSLLASFGFVGLFFLSMGVWEGIRARRKEILIISLISLSPLAIVAVIVEGGKINYLLQFIFIFIMLIAAGLVFFTNEIVKLINPKPLLAKIFFVGAVAVTALYLFYPAAQNYLFTSKDYQPLEHKQLGIWMKENIAGIEKEIVLARKPDVAFYAGSDWQVFPNLNSFEELAGLMRKNNINYLVVDDRYFKNARPQFAYLLNADEKQKDLEAVKSFSYYEQRAILYRLKDEKN